MTYQYIIPFSRDVAEVGDTVFCYMTLDGVVTEHKGGYGIVRSVADRQIKHRRSGVVVDFRDRDIEEIYPQGLFIDRTPNHIIRLRHVFKSILWE